MVDVARVLGGDAMCTGVVQGSRVTVAFIVATVLCGTLLPVRSAAAVGSRITVIGGRAGECELSDSGSDHRGEAWQFCDLDGHSLVKMDFREADLSWSTFVGAVLFDTSFAGATLRATDFRNADLTVADMTGADLRYADLSGATVDGLRCEEADVDGASLPETWPCPPVHP